MKKVLFLGLLASLFVATPSFATDDDGGGDQAQGQLQGQGQAQGQLQGQQQGQIGINRQAQGQIGINESENNNTNIPITNSNSDANSDATGIGVGEGTGVGAAQNNISNDYSSDDLTLYLPDPVDINLPQNTQPGITLGCDYLQSHIDYTGGDSTGVSIWVFGFANSNTPDTIPENQVVDAVVACGLSDQLLDVARSSYDLSSDVVEEVEYMVLQQLLKHLYATTGEEYKEYMLPLGAFNRQVDDMMAY